MATQLADQLRKLAVPQSSAVVPDKTRPSLLFDPREAANFSKEIFYQIGLDGLHELIQLNAAFSQFENSLFSLSSKDFERSVQTEERNKTLDKHIRKFLLLLSPYFLLSYAHKALEWLIYRFGIQDYNKEDFLMLILPYHETNIFVRALQLIKIHDESDRFSWLKPLQKHGVRLTKSVLFNHAATNVQFLKCLSKFLTLLMKQHTRPSDVTVGLNFYCVTAIGVIERAPDLNETHVSHMLPVIMKGLSSEMADFTSVAYVITAKLCQKLQLSDKILEYLVEKIVKVKSKSLHTEAVLLLIILYQSQNQYRLMNSSALESLATEGWFTDVLQTLNDNGSCIEPLLEAVLVSALKFAVMNDDDDESGLWNFLKALINGVKLDKASVVMFINNILEAGQFTDSQDNDQCLSELLQMIERQYPEIFDSEIDSIFKICGEDMSNEKRDTLRRLLHSSMEVEGSFGIFQKLYHPEACMRKSAIQHLVKNFENLKERQRNQIRQYFISRLSDENSQVVEEVLSFPKNILLKIIDEQSLKRMLVELSKKYRKERGTCEHVLRLLCLSYDKDILLDLLPFLLPQDENELRLAKIITSSPFGRSCVVTREMNTQGCRDFCAKLLKNLDRIKDVMDLESFVSRIQSMENLSTCQQYLILVMLSNYATEKMGIERCSVIIERFHAYLKNSKLAHLGKSKGHENAISTIRKGKFPLESIAACIHSVISKTAVTESCFSLLDFQRHQFRHFFNTLIQVCLIMGTCQVSFECLLKFCKDWVTLAEFLLNYSCSENSLECVRYVRSAVNRQGGFAEVDRVVVPYLLVLACNEASKIRTEAMSLIKLLSNGTGYGSVLQYLADREEEVLMDHQQVPLVIQKALCDDRAVLDKLIDLACNKNCPRYLNAGLLKLLMHVNIPEIFEKSSNLASFILKEESEDLNEAQSIVLLTNIKRLDESVAESVVLNSHSWNFMEFCLKKEIIVNCEEIKAEALPALILVQIDRYLFGKLTREVKKAVLDAAIETATFTKIPAVLNAVTRLFKHIDLDVSLILQHLIEMKDVKSQTQTNKRKRTITLPTIDILDTPEWKKGITILELIQNKKKLENVTLITPLLFDVLKKCLDFDEQSSVEYPKQLLLSSVLNCCSREASAGLINVELIVQCIRASQNPQTHHHALLLLAQVTPFVPDQVLHHIMAIFTFMGSSVLRHDDAYSFQIISRIIDSVVPIVIGEGTIKVLRVFVDVMLDVPEHRRLPLYMRLLEKIDAKRQLHTFLLLVFEAHVVHSSKNNSRRIDIAIDLCTEFSVEIVLNGCINILEYLIDLPLEREKSDAIFDVVNRTPKQFRHYKYTIVQFLSNLLSSSKFMNVLAQRNEDQLLELEPLHRELLVKIITHIQSTSKVTDQNLNAPHAQFWKAMLHSSYDVLDSVNALLTPRMFLLVTRGLMVHSLNTIKKRILELFNHKLQNSPEFFSSCSEDEMFNVVVGVVNLIKQADVSASADFEVTVQTALLSLKLLIKYLAPGNPERFVPVMDFITNMLKVYKSNENVLASVILCLGELCANLRAHAISALSSYLPSILRVLKTGNNLLLLCAVTALQKIVANLSLFLSSYLVKILCEISRLEVRETDKTSPIAIKLKIIQEKIGSNVPHRVLIPNIQEAVARLTEKQKYLCIGPVMKVLSESVSNLQPSEIHGVLPDLTTLFIKCLEFRVDSRVSDNQIDIIEKDVIKAITILIMKLSENTFRPLYYKIFDWATRTHNKPETLITFYNLSHSIAESLKGLFLLFAGHIVNNAASTLQSCNEDQLTLLDSVLKTLHCMFLYDTQSFVNKDRFDLLMQPLVDQLENMAGGEEVYKERSRTLVIPCVTQFAVAASNDALWKLLNYQILLKMRDSSPVIRLITLECFTSVARKLGEDFLPLLPESIPFLAELLEDEDESVEKGCEKAIQELEKVLGKPLKEYF